jgi:dienelactone hydrolase
MSLSRRAFCQWLGASGFIGTGLEPPLASLASEGGAALAHAAAPLQAASPPPGGPHLGTLYPFIQKQADRSGFELSFLHDKFRSLKAWQPRARTRVFDRLFYAPAPVAPRPEVIRRDDRGDHIREDLTFQTTPDVRVPACILIPKSATGAAARPAPAIVVLHCHGGMYVWGYDKVVETPDEHPVLQQVKQQLYGGKSIATELVRRGYVVITIDMFYWGQRRLLLDDDPPAYRDPRSMTNDEVAAFNRRSQQSEQLVARSLFTAGITWPGVVLWDDLRTVDYLITRPEVDPKRIGCVGLSVGGYRSFLLAALDPRIKAAVDVCWMTSFGSQIKQHVVNTVGFSFHIIGLYRDLDLPDLAALIAPRSLMVISGSQDRLFAREGVDAAFAKIEHCFRKAGAPDRQNCRLYDAPHQFNAAMQGDAWDWLARQI